VGISARSRGYDRRDGGSYETTAFSARVVRGPYPAVSTASRIRVRVLSVKDQMEEGCLWGTSRSCELMIGLDGKKKEGE
jgi:hypothetical protein